MVVAFLALAGHALAVTVFQTDTFDSDDQNWRGGSQSGQVSDGGPNGAGDGFYRVVSTGSGGPGSRFIMHNPDDPPGSNQWGGDYLSTEVSAIVFDAINLGNTDLHLRLVFGDVFAPFDDQGTWFVSPSQILQPGSGWTTLTFPIDDNAFLQAQGNTDFEDVMLDVFAMRILSAVGNSPFGDVLGTIQDPAMGGFDNIRAIPEPGVPLFGGLALALLARRRRRR